MSTYDLTFLAAILSTLLCHVTSNSAAVQLQTHNIDDILNHNELVLVNFYADWCRFSQMLKPVFEETAKKVAAEFPTSGSVVLGTVDCDRETGVAQKYQVNKYPTLKLFRNGQQSKREYRGQRSADSMANFIKEQMIDPVIRHDSTDALDEIDTKKRHMIGYFDNTDGGDYSTFRRIGSMLRDDCLFHVVVGEESEGERMTGNRLVYRPAGDLATDMLYTGPLQDFDLILKWATDKCVPLVREITFENAEELTEEGLPFLILFHHIDDTETPEKYKSVVARELLAEKSSMNFLTADGEKFTHPLHHLGKTAKDLPILAIDSFRHMYIWKLDPKTNIENPGALRTFVKDLQSGKLHREFHHGPDPAVKSTDNPDGSNETALAAGDDKGPDSVPDNMLEFNVQQQMIIHSNGMRMQVIRFVQLGRQQPVDLREHLNSLNLGALLGEGNPGDDEGNQGDDNVIHVDHGNQGNKNADQAEIDGNLDNKDSVVTVTDEGVPDFNAEDITEEDLESLDPDGVRKVGVRTDNDSDDSDTTVTSTIAYTKESLVQMKFVDNKMEEDKKLPPNSMFRKLAPSKDRYTILDKDEL